MKNHINYDWTPQKEKNPMNYVVTAVVALVLAVVFIIACIQAKDNPPIDGYVTRKTHHPAYYPVFSGTPWVYCIGITSNDRQRACSWIVDEDTYNSYRIGDAIGEPTQVKE